MNGRITVIIPSFKRSDDLKRCLEAIGLQSRSADEILVVGRQEDTETSRVVLSLQSKISGLRLVSVSKPGAIVAMNRGLENALGDLLVFTDDDAEAPCDWLQRIEASFADPKIGAVGGRDWLQLPKVPKLFQPTEVSEVGVLTRWGRLYGNHHCPLRGHTKKVMFLKGVNMAFRRRALGWYQIDTGLRGAGAQVGLEIDLCMQIKRAGYSILFDDRIVVKHHCSPRVGEDRCDTTGSRISDSSYNNHYLIAKHVDLWQSLACLLNTHLLGSRDTPGLLAGVKWSLKGDRFVWQRLRRTSQAALVGFRAGRKARSVIRQRVSGAAASQVAD